MLRGLSVFPMQNGAQGLNLTSKLVVWSQTHGGIFDAQDTKFGYRECTECNVKNQHNIIYDTGNVILTKELTKYTVNQIHCEPSSLSLLNERRTDDLFFFLAFNLGSNDPKLLPLLVKDTFFSTEFCLRTHWFSVLPKSTAVAIIN